MSVQAPDQPMGGEMIDCQTAVRMLWDYLDGHLGETEQVAVRQHVARCSHCFPHADFGQVVLDAVAELRRSQAVEPSTALRDRVLTQLRAEGYEGS